MSDEACTQRSVTVGSFLIAMAFGFGLTLVFWQPLYRGAGFVGGDIYSYYLPQKDVFQESVRAGELPLWNHRTGWGYPLLAESQTGVFYPFTWLFYAPLELNTAYNANHLTHYVLAFLFAWLLARRLKLSTLPAILAATIYVYGWFPARCSLEWAIIGGTWLPAALWCSEAFLQTRRTHWLRWLALVLCLQLLAGHFAIAFITLLTLAVYVPLRVWFAPTESVEGGTSKLHVASAVAVTMIAAFLLAAVQIVPTWELKANSQRAEVTEEHNPEYGHLPPMYFTQLFASWWYWYDDEYIDTDQAIQDMTFLASSARTNRVEAHLYFGLLPLTVLIVMLFRGSFFKRTPETSWAIIGLLFLAYTPAWFVPITKHLPGFSFFEGPARFGVTTTLAAALIVGRGLNLWSKSRKRIGPIVCLLIIAATVWEFRRVAQQIAVAQMVDTPPITVREQSEIRKYFADRTDDVRLFAPGANAANLVGVASMPTYLGLSPAEYFSPDVMPPDAEQFLSTERIDWMERAGITHVLSQQPANEDRLKLVLNQPDQLLSRAWASPQLFLYELTTARSRAYSGGDDVLLTKLTPNTAELRVELTKPGRVVLTDLDYPGWLATIEPGTGSSRTKKFDRASPATQLNEVFRTVDLPAGSYTIKWRYLPNSFITGLAISGVSWLTLLAFAFSDFRRRRKKTNE